MCLLQIELLLWPDVYLSTLIQFLISCNGPCFGSHFSMNSQIYIIKNNIGSYPFSVVDHIQAANMHKSSNFIYIFIYSTDQTGTKPSFFISANTCVYPTISCQDGCCGFPFFHKCSQEWLYLRSLQYDKTFITCNKVGNIYHNSFTHLSTLIRIYSIFTPAAFQRCYWPATIKNSQNLPMS